MTKEKNVRDYTIGVVKANFYALGLFFPILAVYMLLYGTIYGFGEMGHDVVLYFSTPVVFFGSLITGAVLHELIHAICWSWLDDIPWNKIHFGFKWKMLTPYVHCPEPVEISNYRWGVAMPGLVLGVLPFMLSLIFQSGVVVRIRLPVYGCCWWRFDHVMAASGC